MTTARRFVRQHSPALAALLIIAMLYALVEPAAQAQPQRAALAAQFGFSYTALPELATQPGRTIRAVNPSLEHISAWISSLGAAIALNDLDGDGRSNDACYVDPRVDQVIVSPVPGTGQRYPLFTLDPAPLRYAPATMAPMGCLPGDLNEDGLLDFVVYYWGRTPLLFLQRRAATAAALPAADRFVRQELVPDSGRWYTSAATLADLDGDGHADLIIGNYFPDDARVLDASATNQESMQHSMSRAYNGGRNRFLLWSAAQAGAVPGAQFVEQPIALDQRLLTGWTLGVAAADLDADLLPELYFANDFGPDRLLHNRSRPGALRFELLEGQRQIDTPGSKVLGHDSFKGMGVDMGDVNGDGLTDIFVSNIGSEFALEESNLLFVNTGDREQIARGRAPFIDRSEPLGVARGGWGWDVRLDDFNNDSVPEALQATGFIKGTVNHWPELQELAMGSDELLSDPRSWPTIREGADLAGHQHNPFFVRGSDGRYIDLAAELGIDQPHVTRGIATADVDADGRLDVAIANQWERSGIYQNQSQSAGAFLGLRLRLPAADATVAGTQVQPGLVALGRPAIGATATVHLPDGRVLVREVDGGNGHSGKRSSDLHLGLGMLPPDTLLRVELRWRDARGTARHETISVPAGWHTVQLGS